MKDKIFTYLLFIVAFLGIIGPLALKQYNLSLLGSYLGIPMVLAPLIWLKVRNLESEDISLEEKYRFVFIVFFLFLYELSLLTLHGFELRIIPYYGLVAIMGTLILAQILFFRSTTRIQNVTIIFQIIMLFLNIVWGVTLKYYFFIGRTDIFFHSWLVENLLTTGHINPVFDVYEAFPLFHILSAIIYEICGFSIGPHKVLFITNGIIFTGLLIIIYLLVIRIADKKTAQLAALFA